MRSLTIHGIDTDLDRRISEKSKEYGLIQNRTVKFILQNTLLSDKKAARREMFSDLFGVWTTAERKEFEERIEPFEKYRILEWIAA